MSRQDTLAARRERKFSAHAISILPEKIDETRRRRVGTDPETKKAIFEDYTLYFKFVIMAGKQRIGRATTNRHALKRAHQWCRNQKRK